MKKLAVLLLTLLLYTGNTWATVVCDDAFTDTAGVELKDHTPTTAGTGWTEQIASSRNIDIDASDDISPDGNASNSTLLYTCDYTAVGADQDASILITSMSSSTATRPVLLILRYQDTSNFYAARITVHSTEKAEIHKMVAGTATNLAISTSTPAINDVIKFEVIGDALKIYINDVEEASVTDSSITAQGPVGLGWGAVVEAADDILGSADLDDFIANETAAAGGAAFLPGSSIF